ncbi:hypothetical protein EDD11_008198 [Mortierella claussenii]|nr:hypothetical protein EDD11_008198 [Mortierella claussenii]
MLTPTFQNEDYLCAADIVARRDCGYMGINAQECYNRGCCWDSTTNTLNAPFCFLKQHACQGYGVKGVQESDHGVVLNLELSGSCNRFGTDIAKLTATVDFETESRIRIQIKDASASRYEVPKEALPPTDSTVRRTSQDKRLYSFKYTQSPFTFSVTRTSDGEVLFDSAVAGLDSLVFEDEYLEISTVVAEDANIYGLGEVVAGFRRDSSGTRQTLWSRDSPTPKNENLYGAHPFHLEMRGQNGSAHGVFLRSSNGMDVIMTPKKMSWKVIGGILDFTIFAGPGPKEVINQYTEVIGRPHMPPAWAMGFHQSRYGYNNIDQVTAVVERYRQENLPLDGVWIDIDYMDAFKDFSFDETRFPQQKVRALAEDLKAKNQSMVLIVDPGIPLVKGYEPYETGMKEDVFIKTLTGRPIEGRVWPGQTYFPDFMNTNETWKFWERELGKTKDDLGDNVYPWIDMNEPSNFCNGPCTKDGPAAVSVDDGQATFKHVHVKRDDATAPTLKYAINNGGRQAPLDDKTLAENAVHKNGLRLTDTHNLYGHMEAAATHQGLLQLKPGKRPFILTRSSFAGTGDNWSQWDHLYLQIPGILSFGLFGIPFTGSDICGFNGNTTEELCLRWHQLGALAPFSRNHNDIHAIDQEPYVWPNTVLPAARQALQIRYSLMPYYYRAFERAHQTGQPVWQPLFFRYPQDKATWKMDQQFLLGDSIMVSPALTQGQIQVKAYFPGTGRWFDFWTHQCVMEHDDNPNPDYGQDRPHRYQSLSAKAGQDPIPMSIVGGSVIPFHSSPQLTVAATRRLPVSLIVALDEQGNAQGEMVVDDGESMDNVYQARVSFAMSLGQQLVSHAALQWPSGGGGGEQQGELKGMTAAEQQTFREKVGHGDRIEKITVLGLNFAGQGGERTVGSNNAHSDKGDHSTGPKAKLTPQRRRLDRRQDHRQDRRQDVAAETMVMGQGHSKSGGSGVRWRTQTVLERRDSHVTDRPRLERRRDQQQQPDRGIFSSSSPFNSKTAAAGSGEDKRKERVSVAKVAALTELNINGAAIPLTGDNLQGGKSNGTVGQDPATGFAWEVNQDAGTLTLTGLNMDLFAGWNVNWKMA